MKMCQCVYHDSRFRVHVPIHDVIGDPGVAGKAPLHYGIMFLVLFAVLNKTEHTSGMYEGILFVVYCI